MPGKTTKPLWIVVDDNLWDLPQYQALLAQGHRIQSMSTACFADVMGCDAIHSAKAWQMPRELVKYLEAAVKAARQQVYGGKDANDH